jgi:flagellar basal body-associated protein FliL
MTKPNRRITDALGLTRRPGTKTTWREIVPVIAFVVVMRITADIIGVSFWPILAVAIVFLLLTAGIYVLVLTRSEDATDASVSDPGTAPASTSPTRSSRDLLIFLISAALLVFAVGAGSERWGYSAYWAVAAVALFLPSYLVFSLTARRTPPANA